MQIKNLDQLTVVILTYNRQAYALRGMEYWVQQDVVVHVLDGTKDAISKETLEGVCSDKVFYHHLPISWCQRIAYAMSLVKTPYVVMCCDDEFYIRSGLLSCLNELERDPELVACGGQMVGFDYFFKNIYFWQEGYACDASAIKQDTPFQRMLGYSKFHLLVSFYFIVRTNIWKKAFKSYIEKEFPVYGMGEIQYVISLLYLGKLKKISEAMWLRSYENEPIPSLSAKRGEKSDISLDTKNLMHKWWHNTQNIDQHQECLNLMSCSLSDNPDEQEKIKAHIVKIFEFVALDETEEKPLTLKIIVKRVVLFFFNENVEKFIKGVLIRWFGYSSRLSLKQFVTKYANKGIKVDIEALKKLESFILNFYLDQKNSFKK